MLLVAILLLSKTSKAGNGGISIESSHSGIKHRIHFNYTRSDSSSFTMPFSKAGNLILLKATADSVEGSFVLDSGCPGLVLNITYFRDYPRVSESDEENRGITGTVSAVEHTIINEFSFGTKKENDIKADLVNLGHIENTRNTKIIGLIGMHFLEDCEMIIDYESNLIHFHFIGKKEAKTYKHPMLKDADAYQTLPFELYDNRIVVKTEFANKQLRLVIDCAAETNVLDSRLPNSVFENIAITGRVVLTGVGSKKVEALKGEAASFKIGNKRVSHLPLIVANLEKTCFSFNNCADGILGFDFLSLQKIGFNFVKREMYIWK